MLVLLQSAGGCLELRTLRHRLNVSKANASEVTGTLESHGYIRRERSLRDRRAVMVWITPSGEALLTDLFPGARPSREGRLHAARRRREARAGADLPQARPRRLTRVGSTRCAPLSCFCSPCADVDRPDGSSAATARHSPPKFGVYTRQGEVDRSRQRRQPPLSFKFSKKGKNGKPPKISQVDAYAPIDCAGDGFDVPINKVGTLQTSTKASGKLSFTNSAISLTELVNQGLLGWAPNGSRQGDLHRQDQRQEGQGNLLGQLRPTPASAPARASWEAEVHK